MYLHKKNWRRVSHGIRESWDCVRKEVTQIDKRERERGEERPGECQKNGAIIIWFNSKN
jgi:hypothetical protein